MVSKIFTNDFFRQLFDTEASTYTYLLGDLSIKEAVVIDPVLEDAVRDARLINDLGFKLNKIRDEYN